MDIDWTKIDDYLKTDRKITAIKAYRTQTKEGLREAKTAVDLREYNLGMMGIIKLKGQADIDKLDVRGDFLRLREASEALAFLNEEPDRASRLRQINEVANNLRSLSDYYRSLV